MTTEIKHGRLLHIELLSQKTNSVTPLPGMVHFANTVCPYLIPLPSFSSLYFLRFFFYPRKIIIIAFGRKKNRNNCIGIIGKNSNQELVWDLVPISMLTSFLSFASVLSANEWTIRIPLGDMNWKGSDREKRNRISFRLSLIKSILTIDLIWSFFLCFFS